MDLLPNHNSPVLVDYISANISRFGLSSALLLSSPRKKLILGNLDDVIATGWHDFLNVSSSSTIKLNNDSGSDSAFEFDETENTYCTWMRKYPSAISSFEKITNHANEKHIAIFLDYDGTLSPIVNDPDCAFMSDAMRSTVKHVAEYFPTAIISGRSRDKVYDFVGLTELYYAGSHGMDIIGPVNKTKSIEYHPYCIRSTDKQDKEVNMFQPASKFLPMINEIFRSLNENTKRIEGAKVENNKFCVSVHYRLVDRKNWPVVSQIVLDVLKEYPDLKLTHGRKVLEIRPVINWNKGKAVQFLLESLGLSNADNVLPIYIGDDRTDEDAFKLLREGNRGYGILVSSIPKESNAFYSLRDPSEVMYFLKSLVRWKNSTSHTPKLAAYSEKC